jgi:hypothetical protein
MQQVAQNMMKCTTNPDITEYSYAAPVQGDLRKTAVRFDAFYGELIQYQWCFTRGQFDWFLIPPLETEEKLGPNVRPES